MQLRDRLLTPLKRARSFTEGLLASFQTPAEWTHQLFPGANHALWIAGHLAHSDNYFLTAVDPALDRMLPGMNEKYGGGSHPTPVAADYPSLEETLAWFRERRETMVNLLANMSNAQLASKLPKESQIFTDFASIFEFCTWHEGIHSGQLSLTRRALGHPPLIG